MRPTLPAAIAALLFSAVLAPATHAQGTWPDKAVKIVVPYPAGPGPSDTISRVVGEKLSKASGQPFVVENRGGASGNIATDFVVKSPPDGHTILLGAIGPIAANPSLFKSLPFDVSKDLVPVAFIGAEAFVLVVNPSSGIGSAKDLVAKMKEKPGAFSYASGGNGSGTHLTGEFFQRAAGAQVLHVPYKGGVPALNDVLAGLVSMTFTSATTAANFQKTGKLVPLAITGPQRSPFLPDTPTVDELGLPAAKSIAWYGFFLPSGTPKATVDRVHTQLVAALQDPEVKKKIEEVGLVPRSMGVAEFSDFVKTETTRLGAVIRAANITAE